MGCGEFVVDVGLDVGEELVEIGEIGVVVVVDEKCDGCGWDG